MSGNEQHLKQCLEKIIEHSRETIKNLQPSAVSEPGRVSVDSVVVNMNSFTLNQDENEEMDVLQERIEAAIHKHLPRLSSDYKNYLVHFLVQNNYDSDQQKFKDKLSMNAALQLCHDAESRLASIDAFPAAWEGKLESVASFVESYPCSKDKPGPWGTTLLYSAARNNHLNVVKYLVEQAHCSVNAQNEQDLENILAVTRNDNNYAALSKAASTALHGSCFNGHLDVVQYLVEREADYFIKNQAEETPLMNIGHQEKLMQFFRDYLVLGYSRKVTSLPDRPIAEETRRMVDCIWEYKPLDGQEWLSFSSEASSVLQNSIVAKPDQEFVSEIRLSEGDDVYNVSVTQFLRSSQNQRKNNLAWVRCRGSSVLNFDCCALWQIMFMTHPKTRAGSTPSLEVANFPNMDDKTFQIELRSWYNCDPITVSKLDGAMNYRRKLLQLDLSCVSDRSLVVNLQKFSFENKQKTISGFIRWIPKLISNDESDGQKLKVVDNFEPMTNKNPVPLTTKRLRQITEATDSTLAKVDDLPEDEIGDGASQGGSLNDIDGDDSSHSVAQATQSADGVPHTLNDFTNDNEEPGGPNSEQGSTGQQEMTGTVENRLNNCFENVTGSSPASSITEDSDRNEEVRVYENMIESLKKEIESLESERDKENRKIERRLQSAASEKQDVSAKLEKAMKRNEDLNAELDRLKAKESKLHELSKTIRTTRYSQIDGNAFREFIVPRHESILHYLTKQQPLHNALVGKIPRMTFTERNRTNVATLTGLQAHHEAFKEILKRLSTLLRLRQQAIKFCQRELKGTLGSIGKTLFEVRPSTTLWKQYSKTLFSMLKTEESQYVTEFRDFMQEKSLELGEPFVLGNANTPIDDIKRATQVFMRENPFQDQIERVKFKALEKFIELNISYQKLEPTKKPRKESVDTLQHFIDKLKRMFQQEEKYRGCEVSNFGRIPRLLQQLMMFYHCFLTGLPLFDSSIKLLNDINANHVIAISTSTGSGKSTLLPSLLVADGYDRVIVTQPRRLPCTMMCDRVNNTMKVDTGSHGEKVAGWAVSGDERNPRAQILYLTDGLLKERLLNDENFIPDRTRGKKPIVIFIDEVHERSVNIDLCLGLVARLLTNKPALLSKVKVIISSATLHTTVSDLFKRIKDVKFIASNIPLSNTLHRVTKHKCVNKNILSLVQELYHKRQRQDQILCFVSSASEVNQCCRLLAEMTSNTIVAYPLVQSQSAAVQMDNLQKGSVFFSTTVAETSLTFPSLKYVIDTGMINVPVYDIISRRMILSEIPAAESTMKQRLGRLGRTQDGEYYALFDYDAMGRKFPKSQILQTDLMTLEFSLRKSPMGEGLQYFRQFLPEQPPNEAIDFTVNELIDLNVLNTSGDRLTNYGKKLAKLPDFGSLALSRCVLAALLEYDCGRDLICLASILSVLNTTTILTKLPQKYKSPYGDFMTLLNVMNDILLVKQSVAPTSFNLTRVCEAKQLTHIRHIIGQALRRYTTLEVLFDLVKEYRQQAQISSNSWESIARALLTGYSNNVFVSKRDLKDRVHHFVRYSNDRDVAVLDLKSTLVRPISQPPVSIVLARDILYLSTIRSTAVISFIGEVKADWIQHVVERQILLNNDEDQFLTNKRIYSSAKSIGSEKMTMGSKHGLVTLAGPAGSVLNTEVYILEQSIIEEKFYLENKNSVNSREYINLSRNLESLIKMTHIFNPMIWRWETQKQVKITVNGDTSLKTCEITVRGRHSQIQEVKEEFDSFLRWLQDCAVVRSPSSGVPPRLLRPQMRHSCEDIEKRIAHVTDPERTYVDVYEHVKGPGATRETRMEVVAWVAVCKFDCKLEGGFVRDWIVGKYVARPPGTNNNDWIESYPNYLGEQIPSMDKRLVPADLDCQLPTHASFDIERFQDELFKYGIRCTFVRERWRYILLMDKNTPTGPFTMDLIEPHVALTHDRIDFDVSNLILEKKYTRDLGMRIDIQQKPYSIELETIVANIKNKRFYVLRNIDKRVAERIKKMVEIRGWKQLGQPLNVLPNPHAKYNALLVPLHYTSTLYQSLEKEMRKISGLTKIVSMEEIKNPHLQEIYDGMKKVIAKQCPGSNPNERPLFHGTGGDGVNGIIEDGFDDRYFNTSGAWGHGSYFADDPQKSHKYTAVDPNDQTRVIFYSKVLLGIESVKSAPDNSLVSAPVGHHSVRGTAFTFMEYIVYRYGQALPYIKIIYKA